MSERHCLYRFFDANGVLLYIGISMTPWERFRQHRGDKPWWDDIRSTTMEPYPDRESVREAERAAIIAEKPLHNVVHNRGRVTAPAAGTSVTGWLKVGDYVALGLMSGKCPIGYVDFMDDTRVTLILKSWLTGRYDLERRTYRQDDIEEVRYAPVGADGLVDDVHLGAFQAQWAQR